MIYDLVALSVLEDETQTYSFLFVTFILADTKNLSKTFQLLKWSEVCGKIENAGEGIQCQT